MLRLTLFNEGYIRCNTRLECQAEWFVQVVRETA